MPLEPITVLDNDEAALSNRQGLFIDRNTAAHLGHDTLKAIREGNYRLKDGTEVDWSAAVAAAVDAKETIPPEMQLPKASAGHWPTTSLTVANTTTLGAAKRLVDEGARPLVLNMANGISPGGGFLSGARAQEEVLCRSSALHATLDGDRMYSARRARSDYESSDWTCAQNRLTSRLRSGGSTASHDAPKASSRPPGRRGGGQCQGPVSTAEVSKSWPRLRCCGDSSVGVGAASGPPVAGQPSLGWR